MKKTFFLSFMFLIFFNGIFAQTKKITTIPAEIDFSKKILDWDGFGFNYVETAQTRDYDKNPQDYGGFSLLNEQQQKEVLDLVFGKDGLQIQIVKMFLDPYHQTEPGEPFDHERTTKNMLDFVSKGLDITQKRGDNMEIITTLYGPPAWATQQKFIGGRDLDKSQTQNLCNYMAHWVHFLKENNYPVKYLSMHNEGEDFYRWNFDEGTQRLPGFDFNMFWTPEQVNMFLKTLPKTLAKYDLETVEISNGETSNWTRFYNWGYAHGLHNDDEALDNLGLLTTHGFIGSNFKRLSYGLANGQTTELIRQKKPNLHAWVTSYSWGEMGTDFIYVSSENIYSAKANALIPWAGIQNPAQWIEGDPNPGSAIKVTNDGNYIIQQGYYFYKQLTRAGRRGMSVVKTTLPNPVAFIIAFGRNKSENPDAFVVTSNIQIWSLPMKITLKGTQSTRFIAYRTSEDGKEKFSEIGIFEVKNGSIIYNPPAATTTTFIAVN